MSSETRTWHHGLIARWWAEFNVAPPGVLAYFSTAIRRFGEPALDLGCGTGRILIPLVRDGLDVDGVDVSADMIAEAESAAHELGLKPSLRVQPLYELAAERRYNTAFRKKPASGISRSNLASRGCPPLPRTRWLRTWPGRRRLLAQPEMNASS